MTMVTRPGCIASSSTYQLRSRIQILAGLTAAVARADVSGSAERGPPGPHRCKQRETLHPGPVIRGPPPIRRPTPGPGLRGSTSAGPGRQGGSEGHADGKFAELTFNQQTLRSGLFCRVQIFSTPESKNGNYVLSNLSPGLGLEALPAGLGLGNLKPRPCQAEIKPGLRTLNITTSGNDDCVYVP
ncbi:hypothetical protein FB451DRAFT_1168725 [Mycena latifolia]|nr:hypothetical protein FB451DRAFT_1168725 [Mycena latifolia]